LNLIHSGGLYEVQKYVNQTDHVYQWIYAIVGIKQFNDLSSELQQVVREASMIAQEYGLELIEEAEEKYINELKKQGMEFIEVDKKAFMEKAKPAAEKNLTSEQKELYQKIQAL